MVPGAAPAAAPCARYQPRQIADPSSYYYQHMEAGAQTGVALIRGRQSGRR
jgi:hypothetical protein